jgi:hypothetical protein
LIFVIDHPFLIVGCLLVRPLVLVVILVVVFVVVLVVGFGRWFRSLVSVVDSSLDDSLLLRVDVSSYLLSTGVTCNRVY